MKKFIITISDVIKIPKSIMFFISILSILLLIGFQTQIYSQTSDISYIEGYFNVAEKIYADGSFEYEYYLFQTYDTDKTHTYQLIFETPPVDILSFSGRDVKVGFHTTFDSLLPLRPTLSLPVLPAESIVSLNPDLKEDSQNSSASFEPLSVGVPKPIKTVVALVKFSDFPSEPHTPTYFKNRFFDDVDSLSNYWSDTSYNNTNLSGQVINWTTIGTKATYHDGFSNFYDANARADTIALIDSIVDFDGPDNIIQNTNPDFGSGENGDDVDSMMFIHNTSYDTGLFAFAYLSPRPISTDEGLIYMYVSHYPDLGNSFAVGPGYQNGIGVAAHEMGHTFGWYHTPPPPPATAAYQDPWSIMSGWNDLSGPPGVVSFNRDEESWIPLGDIITVNDGEISVITLDVLNDPSPSSNYLMAKIPFSVTERLVNISPGSYISGCQTTFSCYLPYWRIVQPGDTVVWKNLDSETHTVVSGNSPTPNGVFDSGSIVAGQEYSRLFDSAGNFSYFCQIHPWMEGFVIVQNTQQDDFYTLEARKDSTFDHTPFGKMGLMIYHFSPVGHPFTAEIAAPLSLVDTTSSGDWTNSDLDLGDSFSANAIKIKHLSQTNNTITVEVQNNFIPTISANSDAKFYEVGDTINFLGNVNEIISDTAISTVITDPNDSLVSINQIILENDTSFSNSFLGGGPLMNQSGVYTANFVYSTANDTAKFWFDGQENLPGGPDVIIVADSSTPGCEQTYECLVPNYLSIEFGDTVTWLNGDSSSHNITSGTAIDGPDGIFYSDVLISGQTFNHQFLSSGTFEYFDIAHPWIQGTIEVSEGCIPPVNEDWIVEVDCTLMSNSTAPSSVIIQNNTRLRILEDMTLDIDFSQFNLTVKSGSGVLIKPGGKIT